jgi:PAS domain S-box-containing protein
LASLFTRGAKNLPGLKINPDWFEALEPDWLLREALAAGNVGVWSWDFNADEFSADAVARRLWGLPTRGDIAAEQALAAVHPDDVATLRTAALSARASGEFLAIFRLKPAFGGVRWLRVRGRTEKTPGKDRIVGVAIDITERKRVEADLSATEERLRRAQELGGAVPFEWDAQADHLIAPSSFSALYGIGPDEPFDLAAFLRRVHPDDRARVAADHRRLLADPAPYESEFRVILPDGRVRWILSRGEAIRDTNGVPCGIAGINLDITTRRHVEDELRRSKREARARFRELKALYQNAPVGLALLDRDLKFVRVNEALAHLNGVSVDGHGGRYAFDIMPSLKESVEPLMRQVLETGQAVANVEIEGETPHAPGVQRRWVEHFYPIKNDAGAVTGIGVVCEEVTEHRRVEQSRDLLSRELSHRIKNLFAVISSIVRLSARGNNAAQDFAKTICGRIEALGRAHDYVRPADSDHQGPLRPTRNLNNLLHAILEPWTDHEDRIRIACGEIEIGPAAATGLALAVHEFATNAAKYGALSAPGGTVEITCQASEDVFSLVWTERGGPPIDQAPVRQGFGTTLAHRSIGGELGGTITADWARGGLTLRIGAPAERLER